MKPCLPPAVLLLMVTVAFPAAGQTRADTLRGRVSADSGRTQVEGADITVTRAPDRRFKQTKSAPDGSWRIDWPDGTGDYLIHVVAAGYETFRKRVTRTDSSHTLVVDLPLQRVGAQQLAAVMVQAERARPTRGAVQGVAIGASETSNTAGPSSAVGDRLSADLAGDLTAAALLGPGLTASAGGFSALGLAAGQNTATLNGMMLPGGGIPRDLPATVRVSTSIYDPSVGWFSGARTNVQVAPGGLFSTRRARVVADLPTLQTSDPISSRLGQRYLGTMLSSGGTGQLVDDRIAYTYGVQGARRAASIASLATRDALVLREAGVASDSVGRLLQLTRAGDVAGETTPLTDEGVVVVARLDHAPFDWTTLAASKTTWGLTGYGIINRTMPQGWGPLATSSHAGKSETVGATVQASYSTYFGRDYLADVRSGVTCTSARTDPIAMLPEGRVLVASHLDGAADGIATLEFGGNGGSRTRLGQWTWETTGDFQFYPAGFSRHRVKVSTDSRVDRYTHDVGSNLLGSFSFLSLADLEANRPSAFSRTLTAPRRTGGAWNGFVSIGDLWRVAPTFQLLYGARVEGNAFLEVPAYNSAVDAAFHARTDRAPDRVGVSPRLGFDLNVPHLLGGRGITVRGGVGKFRNLMSPTLLSTASAATGLADGVRRVACLGSAVPTPDWSAFARDPAAIPTACANAGGSSPFGDAAPEVQSFAPDYGPQTSWRGNLAWASRIGRFPITVEGVYSRNLSQPGVVDLNFAGVEQFKTSDEARPVYVPATSITASGMVSPVAARGDAAFGRITQNVSDLLSVSRQATVSTTVPVFRLPTGSVVGGWRLAYTYANNRARQRGFDGTTFADPRTLEWSRGGGDVRHQIVSQMTLIPADYVRGVGIVLSGRAQSGTPFTPIIRSDVNGDGLANDRPTIVGASGASLANGAPRSVRDCLERQFDKVAGRNSCEGPWTASMNTSLIIGRDGVSFLPSGVELVLNFSNPLGGIDRLVHGAGGLRGWGAPASPDPVLYTVRGFDPQSRRFIYDVNQRFGRTVASSAALRAPFRVSLDVSIDLAPPRTQQQLDRWLNPGRAGHSGEKVSAPDLARRLQRNVPDPYAELVRETDPLLLTRDQVTALQTAQTAYRARVDALWTSLAAELAVLPDQYDASSAFKRADARIGDAWELTRVDVRSRLAEILSPVQLSLMSGWAARFYNANAPFYQRVFVP